MNFDKELARLALERKRSVHQIARSWGDKTLVRSPESSRLESDNSALSGSKLVQRLLYSAKDLYGRVVGRNKDDASFICRGLEALEGDWGHMEDHVRRLEFELSQALSDKPAAESARSRVPSSPESADSNYAQKQHRRIQQVGLLKHAGGSQFDVVHKNLRVSTVKKPPTRLHRSRTHLAASSCNSSPKRAASLCSSATSVSARDRSELEAQEGRLQEELRLLKAKWEAIMAKTMEQQAAVHRQQIQEREAIVAKKEAEIQKLRRNLPEDPDLRLLTLSHVQSYEEQPPTARRRDKYMMAGRMVLGQTLQIVGPQEEAAQPSMQWYRITGPGSWYPISGATRNQYSPEPFDVGCALGCCISPPGSSSAHDVIRVGSKQPVASYPGFDQSVEALTAGGGSEFNVVIVQRNGMLHTNREVCGLEVASTHITLRLPNAVILQQPYTATMQVCGARGAGDAAAQGVFLAFKPHEVYMLACETAKERNACILLIRKMAALRGFSLKGPEESKAGRS